MALGSGLDLLILDIGLPGKNGFEVLSQLRGQGEKLLMIIFTARDDIQDKVTGLRCRFHGSTFSGTPPQRTAEPTYD